MKNTLIVLAIVILVGVGYFYFVKKDVQIVQQPTPTKTAQASKSTAPTPNWKTYRGSTVYGDQYKFSVSYPADWTARSAARGGEVLVYSDCQIILGVGGGGTPGTQISSKTFQVSGKTVSETTYQEKTSNGTFNFVYDWFSDTHGTELVYHPENSKCLMDYNNILSTFKVAN